MGAWIETDEPIDIQYDERSHPEWVRGLKLDGINLNQTKIRSHPEWVRGLKLVSVQILDNGLRGRTPSGCVD